MSNLDESQARAVEMVALRPRMSVVTGGPGRGKTYTCKEAIAALCNRNIALAAPTGKAAKRMTESIDIEGLEAKTIHRLLGFKPQGGFTWGRGCPLPHDVVLIDESSMADSALLANLCDALHPEASLVMIGDADQLPPVGPGQPFVDLIRSERIPVARLMTNWRQRKGSLIAHNADRANVGLMPEFGTIGGHLLKGELKDDCFFIEADDHGDLVKDVTNQFLQAKDRGEDVVVLAPQRTLDIGVDNLNIVLQNAVNAEGEPVPRDLRIGDPVIQTKNNYDLGVFNGETGVIVGTQNGEIVVDFQGRQVAYSTEAAVYLKLSYAMTVHKSQGSEYQHVIFVCHSSNTFMLSRPLIYTAMTRAKVRLTIIGNPIGLHRGINNTKVQQRNTWLSMAA